ncbi:hypothetical protein LINGRAHAP2_LOCUS30150, partial [Linum grandiflorum]
SLSAIHSYPLNLSSSTIFSISPSPPIHHLFSPTAAAALGPPPPPSLSRSAASSLHSLSLARRLAASIHSLSLGGFRPATVAPPSPPFSLSLVLAVLRLSGLSSICWLREWWDDDNGGGGMMMRSG